MLIVMIVNVAVSASTIKRLNFLRGFRSLLANGRFSITEPYTAGWIMQNDTISQSCLLCICGKKSHPCSTSYSIHRLTQHIVHRHFSASLAKSSTQVTRFEVYFLFLVFFFLISNWVNRFCISGSLAGLNLRHLCCKVQATITIEKLRECTMRRQFSHRKHLGTFVVP